MPVRHMLPIRVTRAVSCIALVLWAPHLHTCTQCSHSSSHIQIHTTPGTRMTWRTRAQLPSTSLTCTASRPRTLHFKWPPSTPSCGAEAARSRCCQAPSDQSAPLQPCKARLCNFSSSLLYGLLFRQLESHVQRIKRVSTASSFLYTRCERTHLPRCTVTFVLMIYTTLLSHAHSCTLVALHVGRLHPSVLASAMTRLGDARHSAHRQPCLACTRRVTMRLMLRSLFLLTLCVVVNPPQVLTIDSDSVCGRSRRLAVACVTSCQSVREGVRDGRQRFGRHEVACTAVAW
jgi:hypothetical protein